MSTPADRRAPDLRPRPLTGVCAQDRHDECSGRVYAGHSLAQGGARYDACACPCHLAEQYPKAA